MSWTVKFLPEALEDFEKLDGSSMIPVRKAIKKVAANPVSIYEGGYGHPLSNLSNAKLAGYYKIKLKASGIRIVYRLVKTDEDMLIIVIGARADNEVYELADKRAKKNGL